MNRNIILVTGPFATGKTEIIRNLIPAFNLLGYPIGRPISDADSLLPAVARDDQRGGYGHFHPWCEGINGHTHPVEGEQAKLTPFRVTDNKIIQKTITDFWQRILDAPKDRYYPAELGFGENRSSSPLDYSAATMIEGFVNGSLPREAVGRILGVVIPQVSWKARLDLNEGRKDRRDSDELVSEGLASWYVTPSTLKITSNEEPEPFANFFSKEGVPIVEILPNGHGTDLEKFAKRFVEQLQPIMALEREGFPLNKERGY